MTQTPTIFKNNAALKKFLLKNVAADKVVGGKTVKVQHQYFYRHGMSAEKWQEKVLGALPESHNVICVSRRDCWNPWPKDSYFEVVLSVA